MILVSPTEPAALREAGITSSIPERYGADYLLSEHGRLIGVQRKTDPEDLEASLFDGRLGREILAMGRLSVGVLLLEGRPLMGADGEIIGARLNREQRLGLLLSVQLVSGLAVIQSAGLEATHSIVLDIERWIRKDAHGALFARPRPRSPWGIHIENAEQLHFLQGVPGIGPGLAKAILEHFGGVPARWTCTVEDFATVPGIGRARADAFVTFLAPTTT